MQEVTVFFVVVSSIWVFINLYIGFRLNKPLIGFVKKISWAAVIVNLLLLPTAFLMQISGQRGIEPLLLWITYLGAGFALTLLPIIILLDIFWLVLWTKNKAIGFWVNHELNPGKNFDPKRRLFMTQSISAGSAGLALAVTGVGVYVARRGPDVVPVSIPFDNLPKELDGFKIAQISDTHVGPTIKRAYLEDVVDKVNATNPDMICITGDITDGWVDELIDDVAPFGRLKAKHGVYYVTGNHEYYWDLKGWMAHFETLGMKALVNEHRVISHRGKKLVIAGVTDYSAGRYAPDHRSDPEKAVKNRPKGETTIVLAHQPRSFPAIVKSGCDLILAGHTHGGQFLPWNFMVPFIHPATTGKSRYKGVWVYVSRGTGYWGPPLRAGSEPEVTLISLALSGKITGGA